MIHFPHETVRPSKKREVWAICDRLFFFTHRKPSRGEVRAVYGDRNDSLNSVDWYLSNWWAHVRKVARHG